MINSNNMKKNTILILLFIFWVSSARSQSKNEQITTLSQQLQDLEVEISTLKKKIVEVKKDLSSCIKEISSKNEKLLYTDNQLNILKDSIELLNRQIIEISNKNLLNESRNSRDFKTFLSTLSCFRIFTTEGRGLQLDQWKHIFWCSSSSMLNAEHGIQ